MMSEPQSKYIGCVRFSGELVQEGLFDARKSAQALLCFDNAVRQMVEHQAPDLKMAEYELPVRIRQGSWEVLIPDTIGKWVGTALGAAAIAYVTKAANKMADKDFDDVGLRDIFKKALEGIQWFIRIGKHLGEVTYKKFTGVKFRKDNTEIGLPNSEGEYLYVPKKYYDMYIASSPTMLAQLARLIEDERILSIGIYENEELIEEKITRRYRRIFTQEEESTEDIILPELQHGMPAVLEGEVTKGNETSNTIGLRYQGHILIGQPQTGSIVRFKPCLFLQCRIYGFISRKDDDERITLKRPKIYFDRIEPLEEDENEKLHL
jgi:hypothetical protein